MDRLRNLAQIVKRQDVSCCKAEDDVVICAAVRTPVTRGRKGGFKDTGPEVMLAAALREAAARAKIRP